MTQDQAASYIAAAEKARDETVAAANDWYAKALIEAENLRKTGGQYTDTWYKKRIKDI